MRLIINTVLLLAILGLVYVLASSIREPIAFKSEYDKRKDAVVERLIQVRKAQEAYRVITGEFAPSFDTLRYVLTNGKFPIVSIESDPTDPDNEDKYIYDTTFVAAFDSLKSLGIVLDSLERVPYSDGALFSCFADTITYQKTLVQVVEVGTSYDKFMGPWADERFTKYDDSYNPNAIIKFGNRNAPNVSGNWER
ncbi:MAG: hypothetical protein KJP00_16440 [Bacteroidia bacterium]|nr:hypothetical protein [Bacteroidia bacterium]